MTAYRVLYAFGLLSIFVLPSTSRANETLGYSDLVARMTDLTYPAVLPAVLLFWPICAVASKLRLSVPRKTPMIALRSVMFMILPILAKYSNSITGDLRAADRTASTCTIDHIHDYIPIQSLPRIYPEI